MMKNSTGKNKELEIQVECMKESELLKNFFGEPWKIKVLSDDE